MQINKIQNNGQTSFGIKYTNKQAWNKDVLKAFENSNLYKFFRWNISSHSENFPEKVLIEELPSMTIEKIENDSVEKLTTIEIKTKQNPIKAFFQKLFS